MPVSSLSWKNIEEWSLEQFRDVENQASLQELAQATIAGENSVPVSLRIACQAVRILPKESIPPFSRALTQAGVWPDSWKQWNAGKNRAVQLAHNSYHRFFGGISKEDSSLLQEELYEALKENNSPAAFELLSHLEHVDLDLKELLEYALAHSVALNLIQAIAQKTSSPLVNQLINLPEELYALLPRIHDPIPYLEYLTDRHNLIPEEQRAEILDAVKILLDQQRKPFFDEYRRLIDKVEALPKGSRIEICRAVGSIVAEYPDCSVSFLLSYLTSIPEEAIAICHSFQGHAKHLDADVLKEMLQLLGKSLPAERARKFAFVKALLNLNRADLLKRIEKNESEKRAALADAIILIGNKFTGENQLDLDHIIGRLQGLQYVEMIKNYSTVFVALTPKSELHNNGENVFQVLDTIPVVYRFGCSDWDQELYCQFLVSIPDSRADLRSKLLYILTSDRAQVKTSRFRAAARLLGEYQPEPSTEKKESKTGLDILQKVLDDESGTEFLWAFLKTCYGCDPYPWTAYRLLENEEHFMHIIEAINILEQRECSTELILPLIRQLVKINHKDRFCDLIKRISGFSIENSSQWSTFLYTLARVPEEQLENFCQVVNRFALPNCNPIEFIQAFQGLSKEDLQEVSRVATELKTKYQIPYEDLPGLIRAVRAAPSKQRRVTCQALLGAQPPKWDYFRWVLELTDTLAFEERKEIFTAVFELRKSELNRESLIMDFEKIKLPHRVVYARAVAWIKKQSKEIRHGKLLWAFFNALTLPEFVPLTNKLEQDLFNMLLKLFLADRSDTAVAFCRPVIAFFSGYRSGVPFDWSEVDSLAKVVSKIDASFDLDAIFPELKRLMPSEQMALESRMELVAQAFEVFNTFTAQQKRDLGVILSGIDSFEELKELREVLSVVARELFEPQIFRWLKQVPHNKRLAVLEWLRPTFEYFLYESSEVTEILIKIAPHFLEWKEKFEVWTQGNIYDLYLTMRMIFLHFSELSSNQNPELSASFLIALNEFSLRKSNSAEVSEFCSRVCDIQSKIPGEQLTKAMRFFATAAGINIDYSKLEKFGEHTPWNVLAENAAIVLQNQGDGLVELITAFVDPNWESAVEVNSGHILDLINQAPIEERCEISAAARRLYQEGLGDLDYVFDVATSYVNGKRVEAVEAIIKHTESTDISLR